MTRRRELTAVMILAVALAGVGCSHGGTRTSPGKVVAAKSIAPTYDVRDDPATRQRRGREEKLGLAMNRLQAGDAAAADALVRDVLKQDPKMVDAYTIQAVVRDRLGDAQGAGAAYRKAAELAPEQGETLNNYGAWLCANGYAAEALVWFDRAVAAPGYRTPAAALANAGGCALGAGQGERALGDLRKALELDPTNAYALESMARLEFGQRHYFEARAFSERRLAAAPATASVLQLAIQIEEGLGDRTAASRYQQRLVKEFPQTTTANPGAKAL